ncbi:MAG: peptidoglycan-binding protein [Planctomycetes bacterium]|nr:peptidoglycan-binding protein [Planctomycetota bacterium]
MTRLLSLSLVLTTLLALAPAESALAQPASTSPLTAQVESGRSLHQGAKGPAVRELQSALRRIGSRIAPDGDFGPRTKAAVIAFQTSKGLVADGVVGRRTLAPNLDRHAQVDFLILPETSERRSPSVGEVTVRAWNEVHRGRLKLVLIGHSFGGYSALRLANKLDRRGIRVTHFLAIDARTMPGNYRYFVRPRNTGTLYNFFQKGFFPGYPFEGADLNQRLRGTPHTRMPTTAQVQARFRAILR